MKKMLVVLVVACFVLAAGAAFAAISGSKHDFSATHATAETCVHCHTPHNADTAAGTTVPLWNRGGAPATLQAACLSCHSGVMGNLTNAPGSGTGTQPSGGAYTTFPAYANLSGGNDHPVGVNFPGTAAAGPWTANSSLLGGAAGTVECSTCHDVHDAASTVKMLKMSNSGSALCLDCHVK